MLNVNALCNVNKLDLIAKCYMHAIILDSATANCHILQLVFRQSPALCLLYHQLYLTGAPLALIKYVS